MDFESCKLETTIKCEGWCGPSLFDTSFFLELCSFEVHVPAFCIAAFLLHHS